MSLDKAVKYKKEKRKSFYRAQAVDKSCRCHGSCDWCKNNRLHNAKVKEEAIEQQIEDFILNEECIEKEE